MEELSKEKRKRGQYKGRITRLVAQLNNMIDNPEASAFDIGVVMKQMDQKFAVFLETTTSIQTLLTEDELVDDDEAQEQVVDEQSVDADGDCNIVQRSSINRSVDGLKVNVKLPQLEIKKFYGDACMWQSFWSQFHTAIDDNGQLAKSEKFVYLKSYLDGDALRSILGLEISDGNYDTALTILKERFGREDLVINSHMQRLLKLVAVKSSTDVKALRMLFDACEIEIRSLESLGVCSSTFGTLLCPIIMSTLPDDLRLEFIVSKGQDKRWSVDDLLTFVKIQVESRERSQLMKKMAGDSFEDRNRRMSDTTDERRRERKWQPSASALQTVATKAKCIFCNKDHESTKCNVDAIHKSRTLRNERRCYLCFKKGHTSTECRSGNCCEKCGRKHHASICFAKLQPREIPANVDETAVTTTMNRKNAVLLQTATAKLGGNNGPAIRLLLDGGSETSFILKETSTRHKLPLVDEDNVNVYSFGCKEPTSKIRRKVRVVLQSFVDARVAVLVAAETETITAATVVTPSKELRSEMTKRSLPMAEVNAHDENGKISVLIGSDYYWQVVTGKIEWLSSTLVAVETIFGWCLQGPATISNFVNVCNALHSTVEEKLSKQVKAFWELEAIGIVDGEKTRSVKDIAVIGKFSDSVKFVDGRYEVRLPWNENAVNLSKNFDVARRRLFYLAKRFERQPELFRRYKTVIKDQINDGIAEIVLTTEATNGKLYYMPHQPVIREEKATTKLRVVFDASSNEIKKASLDECLESGPNLVPDLISILLNFRRRRYGFMADIKQAFLQISVANEDRDAMRFLWFAEDWSPGNVVDVKVYRMTRVLFGATCSPFLLAATIKFHVQKYNETFPEITGRLERQLYVDDFIGSEDTASTLNEVKEISTHIMKQAGMELRKWSTNCKELSSDWNGSSDMCVDEMPVSTEISAEKVLGLTWNKQDDVFSFNVDNILSFVDDKPATKRIVLKTLSRIFDPLGFLVPFTVRAKILFQQLWETGVDWDKDLTGIYVDEWRKWLKDLPKLSLVKVPRCFDVAEPRGHQILIFADASENAYGAVAYLKTEYVDDRTEIKFIMSKCRVSPLKKLSLPRLELMAAVVATRIKVYLEKELVDATFHLWTDAMIVLHWIRGSAKRWKPFVANRIGEIDASTEPEQWQHCSGKSNPADKLTRGLSVHDLVVDDIWWNGPQWLKDDSANWPKARTMNEDKDVANELRAVFVSSVSADCKNVVDEKRYSSIRRLVRVMAWVQRFIRNCKHNDAKTGELSVDEEVNAELIIIRSSQQIFANEFTCLVNKRDLKKESHLYALNPFVDEAGILRIKGRLENASMEIEKRQPIVISRESHLAKLIIVDAHNKVMHMGVQATLTQVRSRFYIPRCRQMIKSLLGKCVICRRLNSKSYDEESAPLPSDRVSPSTPFDIIGIDFAGPLIVSGNSKAYILLITCATTRAVHLELVNSMKTDDTINALKRFVSRRGVPSTVYSDNGRTFKRVNLELQTLYTRLSSTQVMEYFGKQRIKWKFIVERSPWWGGFWERMVRTVKASLKKVLGKSSCSFEELSTILSECEAVINSRPITYVYNSVDELEPWTPSHLLIGKRFTALPSVKKVVDEKSDHTSLLKRWQYRQRLVDYFWRRWQKDYLLDLQSALKVSKKRSSTKPCVGDIVLVREDNLPRQQWTIARIVKAIEGRDNKIRACRVKIASGSTLCRPIQRLYLIESSSTGNGTETVPMGGACNETSTKTIHDSGLVEGPSACKVLLPSTNSRETSRKIGADEQSADDAKL